MFYIIMRWNFAHNSLKKCTEFKIFISLEFQAIINYEQAADYYKGEESNR